MSYQILLNAFAKLVALKNALINFVFLSILLTGYGTSQAQQFDTVYHESGLPLGYGAVDEDGLRTGFWEHYSAQNNGRIISKGNYEKGLKTGRWLDYDEEGNLEYDRGYFEGDYHGNYFRLRPESGDTLERANYVHGFKDGSFKIYKDYGKFYGLVLKEEGDCDQLKHECCVRVYDLETQWTDSNYIISEGCYRDSNRVGLWVFTEKFGPVKRKGQYNANGRKEGFWFEGSDFGLEDKVPDAYRWNSEGNYVDGKREGDWTSVKTYHSETWALNFSYRNGEIDGEFKLFKDSTELETQGFFKEGKRFGSWLDYQSSGGINREYQYAEGFLDGVMTYYNSDGTISAKRSFEKGKEKSYEPYDSESGEPKSRYEFINGEDSLRFAPEYIRDDSIKFRGYEYNYSLDSNILIEEGVLIEGTSVGLWTYYDSDGSLSETGTYNEFGEKEGVWERYVYYEPKLIAREIYSDGLKHGLSEYFSDQGIKTSEANYSQGKRDGLSKSWSYSGSLESVGDYKNGSEEGDWKYFHDNGQLSREGVYHNGKKQGEWREYDYEGILTEKAVYANDVKVGHYEKYNYKGMLNERGECDTNSHSCMVTQYYYYYDEDSNAISSIGRISDHGNVGYWEFFHRNGKLSAKGDYNENGQQEGAWTDYFYDGILESRASYLNGQLDGAQEHYANSGQLLERSEFKNGKYDGKQEVWHGTGALASSGSFDQDKKIGKWVYSDRYGRITSEGNYSGNAFDSKVNIDTVLILPRSRSLPSSFRTNEVGSMGIGRGDFSNLEVWNLEHQRLIQSLDEHLYFALDRMLSNTGRHVLGSMGIYDVLKKNTVFTLSEYYAESFEGIDFAFLPNDSLLYVTKSSMCDGSAIFECIDPKRCQLISSDTIKSSDQLWSTITSGYYYWDLSLSLTDNLLYTVGDSSALIWDRTSFQLLDSVDFAFEETAGDYLFKIGVQNDLAICVSHQIKKGVIYSKQLVFIDMSAKEIAFAIDFKQKMEGIELSEMNVGITADKSIVMISYPDPNDYEQRFQFWQRENEKWSKKHQLSRNNVNHFYAKNSANELVVLPAGRKLINKKTNSNKEKQITTMVVESANVEKESLNIVALDSLGKNEVRVRGSFDLNTGILNASPVGADQPDVQENNIVSQIKSFTGDIQVRKSSNGLEFRNTANETLVEQYVNLVFLNNGGYLLYTPDNYYMGSKEGIEELFFKVGLEMLPYSEFDCIYNRPDIIMKRLGFASEELIQAYYEAYIEELQKRDLTIEDVTNSRQIAGKISGFVEPILTESSLSQIAAGVEKSNR